MSRWGVALLVAGVSLTAGVATPAAAAFPGANGLIAFEHEALAGDHTQTDIYTVKPNGTGVVRLTHSRRRNEFGPAWSADGSRIALWRTPAPFGHGSLWVMAGDGSNRRRLTTRIDARDPAWNPAGTRLVFSRGTDDLFSLRATDGGGRRRLTSGPALDFEPAWSPGGRRIAFTRGHASGDVGDLFVLDVRSREVTRITHSPAYDHQVSWAPGGRRLVFERDFATRSAIFTVTVDGTGLRRLTRGPHFDIAPAYSPNGRRIVFSSDRGRHFHDLWIMRRDGSHLHRLLSMPLPEGFPDWQPVPQQ